MLFVFPFNLIGSLDDCKTSIKKCYKKGGDIIISQFNTTSKARKIRYNYYKNVIFLNLLLKSIVNMIFLKVKILSQNLMIIII